MSREASSFMGLTAQRDACPVGSEDRDYLARARADAITYRNAFLGEATA